METENKNQEQLEKESWMRTYLSFFFWFIAIPVSWAILTVIIIIVAREGSLEQKLGLFLLTFFVLTHCFWALPKLFQKAIEGIFKMKQ